MVKTALITGATTGIGLELAKQFAKNKYDLIIVARDQNKLNEIAENLKQQFNVAVLSISKDLSRLESAKEIYAEVKNKYHNIDVLVNNAGFGSYGSFVETDLNNELEMIQLNIMSLVILSKLFLKDMIQNNSGKLMNVASTAAFQPGPFMVIYYATKAFVLSFSEGVSEELNKSNVTLTVLCPGPTNTDFQRRAGNENTKLVTKKLAGMMSAEQVAKIGFEGLMKGKRILIPGLLNKLLVHSVRFVPRNLVTKVIKFIHK